MAPFSKVIHLRSIYLGLTSLEYPQSESWTCHKEETLKFRDKEALEEVSGPTGFLATARHTSGTTYHRGYRGFPNQFRKIPSTSPEVQWYLGF